MTSRIGGFVTGKAESYRSGKNRKHPRVPPFCDAGKFEDINILVPAFIHERESNLLEFVGNRMLKKYMYTYSTANGLMVQLKHSIERYLSYLLPTST